MATQHTPDSAVMEAGRRALLARRDSGRGEEDIVLIRARGSLVWDVDGREYIDCTSQAWSNNLGANDPRVVEAAIDQLREITHSPTGVLVAAAGSRLSGEARRDRSGRP